MSLQRSSFFFWKFELNYFRWTARPSIIWRWLTSAGVTRSVLVSLTSDETLCVMTCQGSLIECRADNNNQSLEAVTRLSLLVACEYIVWGILSTCHILCLQTPPARWVSLGQSPSWLGMWPPSPVCLTMSAATAASGEIGTVEEWNDIPGLLPRS